MGQKDLSEVPGSPGRTMVLPGPTRWRRVSSFHTSETVKHTSDQRNLFVVKLQSLFCHHDRRCATTTCLLNKLPSPQTPQPPIIGSHFQKGDQEGIFQFPVFYTTEKFIPVCCNASCLGWQGSAKVHSEKSWRRR